MKGDVLSPAWDNYAKRLLWKLTLHELEARTQKEEHEKIAAKINPQATLFVLDEKGKSLSSRDFAAKIEETQNSGISTIQFIIGGADGLSDEIRKQARMTLSFGIQTWPHLLARVMLIEQIYRAQQILAGHPYHRD
jgi:23S rRNA (pseudouridine1915-N3)-methyltransferase